MLIKTLTVGQMGTNCYIVTDDNTLQCAIIDPGEESNTILDYIESNNLKPEVIFLTHGHFDHALALPAVREATRAPVYIHRSDVYTEGPLNPLKLLADTEIKYYAEGDSFDVGGLNFTVIETPGHSPGSVTLQCGSALFTGDTLFRDSCGRTDLEGGDMPTLLNSLLRLVNIEGDFEIYPGHMATSSLDRERHFNYYVKYALNDQPSQ